MIEEILTNSMDKKGQINDVLFGMKTKEVVPMVLDKKCPKCGHSWQFKLKW